MRCRYTGPAIASRSYVLNANGAIIMHASALPQQMGGRPAFPILWLQGQKDPLYVRVPSPSSLCSPGTREHITHCCCCCCGPWCCVRRVMLCFVLSAAVLRAAVVLVEASLHATV